MSVSGARTRTAALLAAAVAALAVPAAALAGPANASQGPTTLGADQTLGVNGTLTSQSGAYRLVMQTDGNLVMYTSAGAVPFATGEVGSGSNDSLVVQNDGNVVQYGSGGHIGISPVTGHFAPLLGWAPSPW